MKKMKSLRFSSIQLSFKKVEFKFSFYLKIFITFIFSHRFLFPIQWYNGHVLTCLLKSPIQYSAQEKISWQKMKKKKIISYVPVKRIFTLVEIFEFDMGHNGVRQRCGKYFFRIMLWGFSISTYETLLRITVSKIDDKPSYSSFIIQILFLILVGRIFTTISIIWKIIFFFPLMFFFTYFKGNSTHYFICFATIFDVCFNT